MPIVPFPRSPAPTAPQMAKVDPTFALMAAAETHAQGRLFDRPPNKVEADVSST